MTPSTTVLPPLASLPILLRGLKLPAFVRHHEEIAQKAEAEGWGRVYWHTETGNAAARRLYDRFRPADAYVRYTLTIGAPESSER